MEKEVKSKEEIVSDISGMQASLKQIGKSIEYYEQSISKEYEKRIYQLTNRIEVVSNQLLEKDMKINALTKEVLALKKKFISLENLYESERKKSEMSQDEKESSEKMLVKLKAIAEEQHQKILDQSKQISRHMHEFKDKLNVLEKNHERKLKEIIKDSSEKEISLSTRVELLQRQIDDYKSRLMMEKKAKKELLSRIQEELKE